MRSIDKRPGKIGARRGAEIFKPIPVTSRGCPDVAATPELMQRQMILKDIEDQFEISTLKVQALRDPEKAVAAMLKLRTVLEHIRNARQYVDSDPHSAFETSITNANQALVEARLSYLK